MIRRPPRSTLFPTRRSSDLLSSASPMLVESFLIAGQRACSGTKKGCSSGSLQATSTGVPAATSASRSEEHTSELQSRQYHVCRLLIDKKPESHMGYPIQRSY